MNFPPVVSATEWQAARDALLAKEKEATRARDALAAERRRLPLVRIDEDYTFDGPDGKATLLDLFEGRRQLLLYHFMFGPNQDAGCDGCSMFVDQIGHLATCTPATPPLRSCPARRLRRSRRTESGWVGPSRGTRRWRASSTSTSASGRKRRSRTSTRTARISASASSCATATASFARTSPRPVASKPSAAFGLSST